MQHSTKLKLAAVHQVCNVAEKSLEFTIQILQDATKVNFDCVMSYIKLGQTEHEKLFQEINELCDVMIDVDKFVNHKTDSIFLTINDKVYHPTACNGQHAMTVTGIRENEIELHGNWDGKKSRDSIKAIWVPVDSISFEKINQS